MFELTINDKVYPFRFGMGFLREINKRVEMTFDEDTGAKRNIGLYYTIIDLMDGVLETLEDVLLAANQSEHPRLAADSAGRLLGGREHGRRPAVCGRLVFRASELYQEHLAKCREFVEKRQAEQAAQS